MAVELLEEAERGSGLRDADCESPGKRERQQGKANLAYS
jgi:hypothetical protein